MKSPRLVCVGLLALTAVAVVGCANVSSSRGRVLASRNQTPYTFALAVTVKGGLQPTPEQWAAVQARISAELLAVGHVLVTDLSLADRIIRVDFRPNPSDPSSSGNAVIVSVRDNPLRQLALVTPPAVSPVRSTPYPTSFGFGHSSFVDSYHSLHNPYNSFGSSYYGFGNSYYDGFTYSAPSMNPAIPAKPAPVATTPTPVTPVAPPRHGPGRHHPPGERPVCPPLLAVSAPVAPSASRIAYPSDRPTRAFIAAARSATTEGRTYASSDRTYSRSDSGSGFRSIFGGSSSSDNYSSSDRYDRYTSHGSVDNAAASARRSESRSVSDRSYSRDTSYRDDSARTKSDYSSSSYSNNSSYSSSSSSYSSSSMSSSSSSSYSAPAPSAPSSSGGSSGTHDSSSNTQQH